MSSETDEWHTPPELFALLDSEPMFKNYCPNCGADMRGEQDD